MTDLREKVAKRLLELNRNPFAAATQAKLNKHFIDDLLNGRKSTVKAANLAKLAKALDWTVADLTEDKTKSPTAGAHYPLERYFAVLEGLLEGLDVDKDQVSWLKQAYFEALEADLDGLQGDADLDARKIVARALAKKSPRQR